MMDTRHNLKRGLEGLLEGSGKIDRYMDGKRERERERRTEEEGRKGQ
jgi:hypothetical protein